MTRHDMTCFQMSAAQPIDFPRRMDTATKKIQTKRTDAAQLSTRDTHAMNGEYHLPFLVAYAHNRLKLKNKTLADEIT